MTARVSASPTLHFTVRRDRQAIAVAQLGEREIASFLGDSGRAIQIEAIPLKIEKYIRVRVRELAKFRKIARNAGKRAVSRIKNRVRGLDLISKTKTSRLFLSSWRSKLVDVSNNGLTVDVSITNTAPYALFVHPKGTAKSRTFVNTDLEPIVEKIAAELAEDTAKQVAELSAKLASEVALAAVVGRKAARNG